MNFALILAKMLFQATCMHLKFSIHIYLQPNNTAHIDSEEKYPPIRVLCIDKQCNIEHNYCQILEIGMFVKFQAMHFALQRTFVDFMLHNYPESIKCYTLLPVGKLLYPETKIQRK